MPHFKYYCFDLDGTLLNSHKEISSKASADIRQLKSNGKHIILASGRHYHEITKYANELALDNRDFIISCDGQYIHNHLGDIIFRFQLLNKNDAIIIDNSFKKSIKYISTVNNDIIIYPSLLYCLSHAFTNAILSPQKSHIISKACQLPDNIGIEKIRIIIKNEAYTNIIPSGYSVHADREQIDIQHHGVNKYSALKQMKNDGYINNLDNLLYFGNDINDIECFENLKWTVAMKGSPPNIIEKAFFVTEQCDNDGVSNALHIL